MKMVQLLPHSFLTPNVTESMQGEYCVSGGLESACKLTHPPFLNALAGRTLSHLLQMLENVQLINWWTEGKEKTSHS